MKKNFVKTTVVVAFGALLFASCASANFDENGFGEMNWKTSRDEDAEIARKAMVGDEIVLSAKVDSAKIPDDSDAIFVVRWSAFERAAELTKVEGKTKDGEAFAKWKIEDADVFYEGNDYTIPRYSFSVETAGLSSAQSPEIDIYGFIVNKKEDEAGKPYTVYRSDGKTISGIRDENGRIDLRWLPLGKYSLRKVVSEESE